MIGTRIGTRVAVVEDHSLFAESLEIALEMEGHDVRRIILSEGGRSVSTLLPAILRAHPRVVLLDLDLGSYGNGVRLIDPLTRAGVNVVVVTASIDRGRWGECLRYGARRVLAKSAPLNDILATIRKINDGLPVISREEREELLEHWHKQRLEVQVMRSRLEHLTHRESEVLGHLMDGHAVREIARLSVVSEATVRTQVKSILSKLEVSSQLAAVGLAHHVGWQPAVG
ncbi:response regulator transcription factor [Nocardioides jensenii]|uniref:response regulator transcription factor n=1 Tax=Nocardioides jensenii TaxID=1843 RepID=UPI00082DB03C|nr:response regulator transcription factor [Nocardioides jensenii]